MFREYPHPFPGSPVVRPAVTLAEYHRRDRAQRVQHLEESIARAERLRVLQSQAVVSDLSADRLEVIAGELYAVGPNVWGGMVSLDWLRSRG